jgi:hypothetical protein
MKLVSRTFLKWLSGQTRLMQYFIIALLLHLGVLFGLTLIKVATATVKIIADFRDVSLPPMQQDDVDPYAVYRDFEYSGPTLGGGGGAGGKGPGGVPTAGGGTPEKYNAAIMSSPSQSATPSVGEVIGVFSEAATAVGRPVGGASGLGMPAMGLGDAKIGTGGIKGPGGPLGMRMGPQRSIAMKNHGASAATEKAVMAALRWLKQNQEPDGSWKTSKSDYGGSGLALLAFLGHGETPDSEEFGATVQKGLTFLVNGIQSDGVVKGGSMYAQGIVTLALSEAYGMTQSPMIREPLERAVGAIRRSQRVPKSDPKHVGGWRYTMNAKDADLSVSGWLIMALKSAGSVGIDVPKENYDLAIQYVLNAQGGSGFTYSGGGNPSMAMTGVGVLCLQFLGKGSDSRVKKALEMLRDEKYAMDWEASHGWNMYAWYYVTQAMFQAGENHWKYWNKLMQETLIKNQAADGHWPVPPKSQSENKELAKFPVYSTALGALMLEVYYRYLPIYQLIEGHPALQTPGATTTTTSAK